MRRVIGYRLTMKLYELSGAPKLYNEAFVQHKAIFVHIPKAAGTSVGAALFGKCRRTHQSWDWYYHCCPSQFDQFFKFTFVRNPFDRLVSAFCYLQHGGQSTSESDRRFQRKHLSKYKTFADFVKHGLQEKAIQQWSHFVPQHRFIASKDDTIMVDFVGRVENLDNDFSHVAKKLGIDAKLMHTNKSKREDYPDYYDPTTQRLALEFYAKDFELLGYPETIEHRVQPLT